MHKSMSLKYEPSSSLATRSWLCSTAAGAGPGESCMKRELDSNFLAMKLATEHALHQ